MVFEWTLYFAQLAEEIRWWQDQRAERVSKLEATWPTFRNIAYPLSTTPLIIRQEKSVIIALSP